MNKSLIKPTTIKFAIASASQALPEIKKIINSINKKHQSEILGKQLTSDLALAFMEGITNAIRHGNGLKKSGKILGLFKISSKEIEIRIADHGKGFNLNKVPVPQFKSYQESGRGIFMMRQLMDSIDYKRGKSKNELILKRNIFGADPETKSLDLLYEISEAILQTHDLKGVYDVILDRVIEALEVDRASLMKFDKKTNRLSVVASRGIPEKVKNEIGPKSGEGIAGYVFQHAKPCLIEDMRKSKSGWSPQKKYKSQSFISAPMIVSPLRVGQDSIGVINVTDRKSGKPFERKDLKLLTTIANQAAAAIHMLDLMQKAREGEWLKREMEMARNIQQSFLPLVIPNIDGYEIEASLTTAQSVGGDFYDVIKCGDLNYVVIADVSGHDMSAALTLANFRAHLRAFIFQKLKPSEIIKRLNEVLYEDLARVEQFISVIVARIQNNQIVLASAGHPAPIAFGKNLCEQLSLDNTAALGLIPQIDCTDIPYQITSGTNLIFYTDGVVETTSPDNKRLGLKHFTSHLKSLNPSAQLIDPIQSLLADFRKNKPLFDDTTLLVLKRTQ